MKESLHPLTPERKISYLKQGWDCDVINVLHMNEPVGQCLEMELIQKT